MNLLIHRQTLIILPEYGSKMHLKKITLYILKNILLIIAQYRLFLPCLLFLCLKEHRLLEFNWLLSCHVTNNKVACNF